ncbi:DUF5916 domain-containing protein [Candidatus Rariloculus sp.]|uniref:DUF5916 domain-containing protein n=1 Tax=Candidatus Rariloculus sp. TaxID=3101265 RepID=UPI003D0C772D
MSRLVAGALVSALAANVQAQDAAGAEATRKSVRVVRTISPPSIDGRLDDAVWQDAEVITDFHQIRPGDGAEPSEPTEVYVLYDDDAFYIGARLHDSEPDRVAAPTIRHGQGLGGDDRLVVIFDPFNTGRSGYRFETNANAVRHDALYQNVNNFENEWSVIWEVAASIDEQGWLAELAIPFKSLPFDPNIDTWGFNFGRGIRRRGEEMAWVSRNRSYNPSILGLASGLEGMNQGLGLDIVPSISANERKGFAFRASDSNIDPSLDIFYRLTPSLNASLTVNTDFSATEVDDRQVNLTRFGLFFPEKRDFFLNDADLFEFGRISREGFGEENDASSGPNLENGRPFFSRRLGLSSTGTPVDLNYGGKVSGRVGRWNIGTLAIRQDEFEAVAASNVFVGRVTANVLAESAVGVIVTDGDPNSNLDNSVTGVDFRYLNSRLPGGRVLEADAWFQQSDTETIDGADSAFGIGVQMPNNSGLRGSFGIKEIEANFNPALGFVNRRDVRDTSATLGYTLFTGGDFLQSIYTGIDAQRIDSLDGGLQTEVFLARLVELENNSRDDAQVQYIATKEVVAEPFTIYEDRTRKVVIAPGRYSFNESMLGFSTGRQRTFSGEITYQWGDFFNGKRTNIGGDFRWNLSRLFRLRLGYDWNDIELPDGSFISRLVRLTTEVAFSPTLSWVTLLQYDNDSEILGVNSRLHWIPTAGREGFIVINHDLQDIDKDNRFNSALADTTIKFNYTFRF